MTFWKSRPPLDNDDLEWQLECWGWLLSNFGGLAALEDTPMILPTGAFFAPSESQGHDRAQILFETIARYMSVDPGEFDLVPQDESIDPKLGDLAIVQNAPSSPAGTFQYGADQRLRVTYDPASIERPMELIATLAHEICHAILFTTDDEPPGGADCEEFATDLAVTFFGFGVFAANSAFEFRQFSDGVTQGWSTRRQGYLTEAEWGFSLAVFLSLKGESADAALKHLKPALASHLKKSLKYLDNNPGLLAPLKSSHGKEASAGL